MSVFKESIKGGAVRIDGDELRSLFPEYTGCNSSLFQGAVSLIVEKIHDLVLYQKQSFVLDGTFSKYKKAVDNINRSLKKNRIVLIFYLYQDPKIAWQFTQKREVVEGRNIPKKSFIEQFLGAENVIRRVRNQFGKEVSIQLVKKDFYKNKVYEAVEIEPDGLQIDEFIEHRYTKEELEELL